MVKNCLTGIRASGQNNPLPLKNNLFILQPAWQQTHPLAQFKALNLLFNGPWLVRGNTMSGYPVAVHAQSAQMTFQSNIVWADTPLQTPFIMEESPQPVISYNCIFYPGGFQPEQHNISADPQFVSAINDDFHLTYDSPCIDAGYPGVELDSDLTVAEIGAYSYLHKADYQASARFVTVGTTVQFTDTSIGHDYPFTTYAWDLNNDNVVESTASSWSHQFDTPGIYTIKYTVATGSLIDEKVLVGAIIVQDDVLPLPANFRLGIDGQNIVLNWNPVQGGLGGQSGNVPFYVLYESDKPDGEYVYTAMTDNGRTTYTRINGAGFKSRFFIVIGFAGSREELDRYIESHRTLRREQTPVNRSK
jgi:plastocyanin